jgi:hypothetical protein
MQLILATNVDLDENKMTNTLYHSFLMASQNRWKCNSFCDFEGGS